MLSADRKVIKYALPAGCFAVLDTFPVYRDNGLVVISISGAQSSLASSSDGFEFASPHEQRP